MPSSPAEDAPIVPTPKKQTMETRMKQYEKESLSLTHLPADQPFIVRLDGHGFSKFTKNLRPSNQQTAKYMEVCNSNKTNVVLPFDTCFIRAMVLTSNDLVREFGAQTGYTHSDEITLIFAAVMPRADDVVVGHHYNGRVTKMTTLMAGYASARFNLHLARLVLEGNEKFEKSTKTDTNTDGGAPKGEVVEGDVPLPPYSPRAVEKLTGSHAYFDARVLVFPKAKDTTEIVNHQIWRSTMDSNRNALSTTAQHYFGHKVCTNKDGRMMEKMLVGGAAGAAGADAVSEEVDALDFLSDVEKKTVKENSPGLDWLKDVPLYLRHGVYCKKALVTKTDVDRKTGESVEVLRSVYENKCFRIGRFGGGLVDVMLGKVWGEGEILLDGSMDGETDDAGVENKEAEMVLFESFDVEGVDW